MIVVRAAFETLALLCAGNTVDEAHAVLVERWAYYSDMYQLPEANTYAEIVHICDKVVICELNPGVGIEEDDLFHFLLNPS